MPRRFTPLVNLLVFSCSGHALHSPLLRTTAFASTSISGRSRAATAVSSVSSGNSHLGYFQQGLGRRRAPTTSSPTSIIGLGCLTSAPATAAMSALSTAGADDGLPYRYRWPRPSATVDCLIYALDGRRGFFSSRGRTTPSREAGRCQGDSWMKTRASTRPLAGSWTKKQASPTAPWCRQELTVTLGAILEGTRLRWRSWRGPPLGPRAMLVRATTRRRRAFSRWSDFRPWRSTTSR